MPSMGSETVFLEKFAGAFIVDSPLRRDDAPGHGASHDGKVKRQLPCFGGCASSADMRAFHIPMPDVASFHTLAKFLRGHCWSAADLR